MIPNCVPVTPYLASQAVHQAEQQGLLLALLRCAEQEVHVMTKLLPPGQQQTDINTQTHLSRNAWPAIIRRLNNPLTLTFTQLVVV